MVDGTNGLSSGVIPSDAVRDGARRQEDTEEVVFDLRGCTSGPVGHTDRRHSVRHEARQDEGAIAVDGDAWQRERLPVCLSRGVRR